MNKDSIRQIKERDFFITDAADLAKKLLGKIILRVIDTKHYYYRIVETEAYQAPEDKACHSYNNKKTEKTKYFWNIGGTCYIFNIYMHNYYCFNIISNDNDTPHGVLIRAVEPYDSLTSKYVILKKGKKIKHEHDLYTGPVKSGNSMQIDKSFNGEDLLTSERISLYEERDENNFEIIEGPRINIDYAADWIKKPWIFYIKNNKFVSKPRQNIIN